MTKFYPNIELVAIQSVVTALKLMQTDHEWLEEAPYPGEVVRLLTELSGTNPSMDKDPSDIDLLFETQKLYRDLNNTPRGSGAEAMAYFRTASVVLGRLLDLTAKAEEIKQYKEFKERVYALFENVLNPDQITDAMEFLRGSRLEVPEPTKEE